MTASAQPVEDSGGARADDWVERGRTVHGCLAGLPIVGVFWLALFWWLT